MTSFFKMSGPNSKLISVSTADYRGLQYNPRTCKTISSRPKIMEISLKSDGLNNCRESVEIQLAIDKSRFTTTNDVIYSGINDRCCQRPPVEKCHLAEHHETTFKTHRDNLDKPRLIYPTGQDDDSKPPTPLKETQYPTESPPIPWSRFPPGGCQMPTICQDPVTKPPTCNCPKSCCSRTVCSGTNPRCICSIPCTHPTGNSLICNACLCYKLPSNEKTSNYFCPRSQSDNPTCPQCKHVLPDEKSHGVERTKTLIKPTKELIKQMQLDMPLPITLQNVCKSYVPLFQRIGSNISAHLVPSSGEVEKPQARSENLSMGLKKKGGVRGKGGFKCNCTMKPCWGPNKSKDKF